MTNKSVCSTVAAICLAVSVPGALAATSTTTTSVQTNQATQNLPPGSEKQHFVRGARARIQRLEAAIARLRLQARPGRTADGEVHRIRVADLGIDLRAARAKLGNLEKSTGQVWRRLRADLNQSLTTLERKVRRTNNEKQSASNQ